ncbi:MAG TPA: hypothetical protein VI636_22060 [Candidatus Angelobacter sp.]
MICRIDQLPAVLTSFAYREEYFPEIEGMLATVKEHHPHWPIVVGRGPVSSFEFPTLEVESPAGKFQWSLPVLLNLGSEIDDWRKITMMKGWWLAKVWQNLSLLCRSADSQLNRVVWLDADARLNGPLDITLEPQGEVIAGAWCDDDQHVPGYAHIFSGMLLLQGNKRGAIAGLLDQWSDACLSHIQNLPPATVPWGDGDQEVLTEILKNFPESNGYTLLKLEEENYPSCPIMQGKFMLKSLIDHWDMGGYMKMPREQRNGSWPPAEEFRRAAVIGSPVPGMDWKPNSIRIENLPAVLTSFVYGEEHFPEIEGMLATVRNYHPNWRVVIGKGPVFGFDRPTLDIQSPQGKSRWTLPVTFQLDGSEKDWLRIVWMKAWWVAQVWHHFGYVDGCKRIVWLDADARLNGPLDIMLEPEDEIVAGPWSGADGSSDGRICSGLLIFQGRKGEVVESIINQWSTGCLSHICNPPLPSSIWQWGGDDQEVLTTVLKSEIERGQFTLCKLDYSKYCGAANIVPGAHMPAALVDQGMMNEKMRLPENRSRNWPPEQARRKIFP